MPERGTVRLRQALSLDAIEHYTEIKRVMLEH